MKSFFSKFWFPAPEIYTLSLFRIFWAIIAITDFLKLGPELQIWYTDLGITDVATVTEGKYFQFSFLKIFPESLLWTQAIYVILLISLVMVLLGYRYRLFQIISFVLIASFHARQPLILNSGHDLMRTFGFFMMFAPMAQVWSLDAYFGRVKLVTQAWAYRMLQFQFSILYFVTFLFKIQGSFWLDGTAVYVSSRLVDFWRYDIPYIFDSLIMIKLMTWGALFIELAMGTIVWYKPVRKYVLIAALLLHLMIEYTMTIPTFQFMALIGLLLFVSDRQLFWLLEKLKIKIPKTVSE